jgi:hypothetical protein
MTQIFSLNDFILVIEMIKSPKLYIFIESCICYLGIFFYFLSFIFWITIYDKFNLIRENQNTFLLLYSLSKFIKINGFNTRNFLIWIIYVILFYLLIDQYQTYIPKKKNNLLYIFIFSFITIPIFSNIKTIINIFRFIILLIFYFYLFFTFNIEINKNNFSSSNIPDVENNEYNNQKKKEIKVYNTLKITLFFILFFIFIKYILIMIFVLNDFKLPRNYIKLLYNFLLLIEVIEVLSYFSGMSIVTFYTYVENNNIILSKLEKKIDDIENNDENIELNINLKNENDDDKEDDKEDDKDDDKDDDDEKDDTKRYKSNYDME